MDLNTSFQRGCSTRQPPCESRCKNKTKGSVKKKRSWTERIRLDSTTTPEIRCGIFIRISKRFCFFVDRSCRAITFLLFCFVFGFCCFVPLTILDKMSTSP